jgi:hypothetical protein
LFIFTAKAQRAQRNNFLSAPRTSRDRQKEFFWRIGVSPILQKSFSLCDLRVSKESSFFEDEWAVNPLISDEDSSAS